MSEQPRFPVLTWGTEGELESLQTWSQSPSEAVLVANSQGPQTASTKADVKMKLHKPWSIACKLRSLIALKKEKSFSFCFKSTFTVMLHSFQQQCMNEGMQKEKYLCKSIAPSIYISQITLRTLLNKFSWHTVGQGCAAKPHRRGEEPKPHTDTLQSWSTQTSALGG